MGEKKFWWLFFSPLSNKIDMAIRLFDALKVEAQSLRFVIQEATNTLAAAYKVCLFSSTWFKDINKFSFFDVAIYSQS